MLCFLYRQLWSHFKGVISGKKREVIDWKKLCLSKPLPIYIPILCKANKFVTDQVSKVQNLNCVGIGNLTLASCIPCYVYQESKILTALYLDHFSGLSLQWVARRDETDFPQKRACLLPLKVQSGSLFRGHCSSFCVHPGPVTSFPWELGGLRNQRK